MKWKIGDVEIPNQVVVAPMAGVTDPAFRQILKEFGAGLLYTEMVSDKGLSHHNRRTYEMLAILDDEHPVSLQLFGSEPESLAQAAMVIDGETKADIIDINMGCPVNKVVRSDAGSKLLQDPQKIYEIVKRVVASVKKPVTVKIRSGWDKESINAVAVAKAAEQGGAAAIAIHPRTRSQMYSGKSDWSVIKDVKAAVSIPVIGNGDIASPEDAKRMLEETGCDAVMIGRAVLGNPWLLRQTVDYLETGTYDARILYPEKREALFRHLDRLVETKGEKLAVLEMRSHGPWYLKGLKNSSHIKVRISACKSIEELRKVLDDYFDHYEEE